MTGRYRDIIFDLDGTLTRPGSIDFTALKRAIGCPPNESLIEFLQSLHGPERVDAWRTVDAYESAAVRAAHPNDGVYAVVDALHALGARLYVLTRNSRRSTRATLHLLGLRRFVTDIVAREDADPKPDPAGIQRLRTRWGFAPARTLMVGDFRFDVLTGAAAGVHTAFLTNRAERNTGTTFPPGHPTHTLHDLTALLRL